MRSSPTLKPTTIKKLIQYLEHFEDLKRAVLAKIPESALTQGSKLWRDKKELLNEVKSVADASLNQAWQYQPDKPDKWGPLPPEVELGYLHDILEFLLEERIHPRPGFTSAEELMKYLEQV